MKAHCYAVLACFLLIFMMPRAAMAGEVQYLEPLTGSRITLPAEFAANTNESERSGQYGKVHTWVLDGAQPDAVQFDVAVKEINAKSMADLLRKSIMDADNADKCTVRDLTPNHLELDEVQTFMGKKDFLRHWFWLLNDGSCLHAQLQSKSADRMGLADAVSIEFAAEKGSAGLEFMTVFPESPADKESVTGEWRNAESGVRLLACGPNLLRFSDTDGVALAFGLYNPVRQQCALWGNGSKNCSVEKKQGADSLTIRGSDGLDGIYVRIADGDSSSGATAGTASSAQDGFRGDWENDSEFCQLKISRSGVTVQTAHGMKVYEGYTITSDGLQMAGNTMIRKNADNGLVMDGVKGVFWPVGQGKGVSQFAAFAPYNGSWNNETASISIQIKNKGMAYSKPDGAGVSTCSVDDKGVLHALKSTGHIDAQSGNLVFEGIPGEFVRKGGSQAAKADESGLTVLAKDADITNAPGVILEGPEDAQNLGGWKQNSAIVAVFPVSLPQAGSYSLSLNCSREPQSEALVSVAAGSDNGQRVDIPISFTGGWGNYKQFSSSGTLALPAGETMLYVTTGDPSKGDYLMNMRSITLTPAGN